MILNTTCLLRHSISARRLCLAGWCAVCAMLCCLPGAPPTALQPSSSRQLSWLPAGLAVQLQRGHRQLESHMYISCGVAYVCQWVSAWLCLHVSSWLGTQPSAAALSLLHSSSGAVQCCTLWSQSSVCLLSPGCAALLACVYICAHTLRWALLAHTQAALV